MTRVKFEDGLYRTLGKMRKLNLNNKLDYINYIIEYVRLQNESYLNKPITQIFFKFALIEGTLSENDFQNSKSIPFMIQRRMKLPLTFNPLEYGRLVRKNSNEYWVKINTTCDAIIIRSNKGLSNKVTILSQGNIIMEYVDKYIDENTFERILNNNKYRIIDNEIALHESRKSVLFIDKLQQKQGVKELKFLTMDIETYKNKENQLIPLSICFMMVINPLLFI